jgi:hypothetical protein
MRFGHLYVNPYRNVFSQTIAEFLMSVVSTVCLVGDIEYSMASIHDTKLRNPASVTFRTVLSLSTLVIMYCAHVKAKITNIIYQHERFFKPKTAWWHQEGAWWTVFDIVFKLFHLPP